MLSWMRPFITMGVYVNLCYQLFYIVEAVTSRAAFPVLTDTAACPRPRTYALYLLSSSSVIRIASPKSNTLENAYLFFLDVSMST